MQDEILTLMVEKFAQHFTPVHSFDESDMLTTEQIYIRFQSFYPSDYSTDSITALLSQHFNFDYSPEAGEFFWLIKSDINITQG